EADEEKGKETRTLIKRGLTHITIILSAILLVICLLLSGCGGKSTFDGSRTSDETGFRESLGTVLFDSFS
ncbi:MAG: hypothetical protein IKH18_06965, partial [Clostridia bacterium]|nr:hypothetical protein [Clostridia bacterium]